MYNERKVSIVITSYNRGFLLDRAIKSVIEQTYKNIEITVVDDHSTDQNTIDVLNHYSDKELFPFINVIILKSNMGANYCRNIGIENSSGYYYTGLDDDDYFSPDRINFLINHYEEKYAFICTNYFLLNGEEIKKRFLFSKKLNEDSLYKVNYAGNQVFTTIDKIKNVHGFDVKLKRLQDQDMWIRLLQKYKIAKRFSETNYLMDVSHDFKRITKSINVFRSYFSLYKKHKFQMSHSSRNYSFLRLYYLRNNHIPVKYIFLSPILFFKIKIKGFLKK